MVSCGHGPCRQDMSRTCRQDMCCTAQEEMQQHYAVQVQEQLLASRGTSVRHKSMYCVA